MNHKMTPISPANLWLALGGLVVVAATALAGAQQEGVLYRFKTGTSGALPAAGLVADKDGNLFGTTAVGGDLSCEISNLYPGCGTVFELSPPSSPGGPWSQIVLYSFLGGPFDGANPTGSLVLDQS